MGIIGVFVKAIAGVAIGTVISGLIAQYASVGSIALGETSIAYSDIIAVVAFAAVAFVSRNKMPAISQIFIIATGSQLWFIIYKIISPMLANMTTGGA